jgi:GTP-binding protein
MLDLKVPNTNLVPLFETIIAEVPPPHVESDKPFQMQISSLDYSSYVGTIGIGRIHRGTIKPNSSIIVIDREGNQRTGRILQLLGYQGLERYEIQEATAGDIIAVTGIEKLTISDTLCDPQQVEGLPALAIDEPTVSVTFQVNDSPFAGREGKYVTSRQIRERLDKELLHDVALRVTNTEDPNKFRVSGRGELHLSILIENMRREGYELGVSRPEVIFKEVDGISHEPYELLTINVEETHQGTIMEKLGNRRGELLNTQYDSQGRIQLEYRIPTRALIGFRTEFMTATSGLGLMYHSFEKYAPAKKGNLSSRIQGVLISNQLGKANSFALFNLQARGKLFIDPQTEVYEGMIIGLHARDNDLVVNATKAKQLTNIRAAGSDENIILTPPVQFTLEKALEFINDDELVEVTPKHIRLRKKFLKEHERKRSSRL